MTRLPVARSFPALCLALTSLAFGVLAAGMDAWAHHPGSHAVRGKGGQVEVEIVVTARDGCTGIAAIREAAPDGIAVPRGSEPLTIVLTRPEGVGCTQALTTLRRDVTLTTQRSVIHLYVVAPDGSLASTERVPVK